jgi:hypothetical protein
MPADLDATRLDAILQSVVDRLPGDWLLIGGALVALWVDARRVTEDVDLVGIAGTGADRRSLLGLADDLGLPVEALNSAADYFVERIPGWREHIEPFRTGKSGRVFRPSPTLFLVLKARRLSSRDLDDCLGLLQLCSRDHLPMDATRVLSEIAALAPTDDEAQRVRRQRLIAALSSR